MPIWSLTIVLLYEIQYFILQLYKQSPKSWLAMLPLARCTLWLIPPVYTSPLNENATTEHHLTQGVHASPSSQRNWPIPLSSTLPKGRVTSQLAKVLRTSGCMDSALNGPSLSLLPPLRFIDYHRKECKNQRARRSAMNTVFWVWHDYSNHKGTTAIITCARPTQGQARWHSNENVKRLIWPHL